MNQEVFKKLYKIDDTEVNSSVVIRIIYQFFYKLKIVSDLQEICFLDVVFMLQDKRFKLEVSKVIVVHWNFNPDPDENYKQRILTNVDPDRDFCKIAFFFLEDLVNHFEYASTTSYNNKDDARAIFFNNQLFQLSGLLWRF